MLQDNRFRWLSRVPQSPPPAADALARQLYFPCGLLRGALAALSVTSTVSAEVVQLPQCALRNPSALNPSLASTMTDLAGNRTCDSRHRADDAVLACWRGSRRHLHRENKGLSGCFAGGGLGVPARSLFSSLSAQQGASRASKAVAAAAAAAAVAAARPAC